VKRFCLIILILIFFFCSCNNSESKKVFNLNNINKSGNYFYLKGETEVFTGIGVSFHENNTIKEKISFRNGKMDGPVIKWFANGQKEYHGFYKNNEKDGIWETWNREGKIEDITNCNSEIRFFVKELAENLKNGKYLEAVINLNKALEVKKTKPLLDLKLKLPWYQSDIYSLKKDYFQAYKYSRMWINEIDNNQNIDKSIKGLAYYVHGANCWYLINSQKDTMALENLNKLLNEGIMSLKKSISLEEDPSPYSYLEPFFLEKYRIEKKDDYLILAKEYKNKFKKKLSE